MTGSSDTGPAWTAKMVVCLAIVFNAFFVGGWMYYIVYGSALQTFVKALTWKEYMISSNQGWAEQYDEYVREAAGPPIDRDGEETEPAETSIVGTLVALISVTVLGILAVVWCNDPRLHGWAVLNLVVLVGVPLLSVFPYFGLLGVFFRRIRSMQLLCFLGLPVTFVYFLISHLAVHPARYRHIWLRAFVSTVLAWVSCAFTIYGVFLFVCGMDLCGAFARYPYCGP